MLESHNDSAVAIAEHIGGSVDGFAEMMNQKAKQIGCSDTFFITPNGLDAKKEISTPEGEKMTAEHSTTASDLAFGDYENPLLPVYRQEGTGKWGECAREPKLFLQ